MTTGLRGAGTGTNNHLKQAKNLTKW